MQNKSPRPKRASRSRVRRRRPEKSPEICRHADGHDRRYQRHRKSDPRQNEWQGDGNETAANAVGKNEKKENERLGGFAIAHVSSKTQQLRYDVTAIGICDRKESSGFRFRKIESASTLSRVSKRTSYSKL